jgi:hypothetical protein
MVIAVVATFLFFGWLHLRRTMLNPYLRFGSPEGAARLEAFFNDPITLPKEWQEVKPFPPDLVEAAESLRNEFWKLPGGNAHEANEDETNFFSLMSESEESNERFARYPGLNEPTLKDKRGFFEEVFEGREPTVEDWESVRTRLAETYAILEAAKKLIRHPSYEMEAAPYPFPPGKQLRNDPDVPFFEEPDSLLLMHLGRLFCLKAQCASEERRWADAIGDSLLAIQIARRQNASSLIFHFYAHAIVTLGVSSLFQVAAKCPDEDLLLSSLTQLGNQEPWIVPIIRQSDVLTDTVSILRRKIRLGRKVDLSRTVPAGDFYKENMGKMVSLHDVDFRNPRDILDLLESFILFLPVEESYARTMYWISAETGTDEATNELVSKVRFDLLRIHLANRILELEQGKRTDRSVDFVPRFFPEDLHDPFANAPYLWDATNETFYSIGPDKIDQGNDLTYSQATKKGDISLVARKPTQADIRAEAEEDKRREKDRQLRQKYRETSGPMGMYGSPSSAEIGAATSGIDSQTPAR